MDGTTPPTHISFRLLAKMSSLTEKFPWFGRKMLELAWWLLKKHIWPEWLVNRTEPSQQIWIVYLPLNLKTPEWIPSFVQLF